MAAGVVRQSMRSVPSMQPQGFVGHQLVDHAVYREDYGNAAAPTVNQE